MLLNNIPHDVTGLCAHRGVTFADVQKCTGEMFSPSYFGLREHVVNKCFMDGCEALGYDLMITYIPRED